MNITVTYRLTDGDFHVQIDPGQEICSGLFALQETQRTSFKDKPDFFRSFSLRRMVSAYFTFEEAGIYSGDILSYE